MKKDFYKKKSLESNADLKSTCCKNIGIRSDKARRPFQQGPGGQALQGPDFLMSALQRANTFFGLFLKMMSALIGPMDGPYKGW